jgi:subtilisin family serine protease
MSRSTKWALAAVSILVVALLVIPFGRIAQPVEASGASGLSLRQDSKAVLDKVAPWVLEKTADGNTAEFLVVLNEQADLSGAERLATKAEKGRYVYETLYQIALQTQQPMLDWLKANGVEYRSYYIVNLIWVKSDRNVVLALAARPEVSRVEGNPSVKNISDETPTSSAKRPNRSEAVEGGVAFIRAPEVWAAGFTGQNMVVGGADTGYRWDHNALKNKYRGWNGTVADHNYNWHDSIHSGGGSCGPNSPAPCDDHGHGTHTIGTAVGDDGAGNQIGVAPGARWIGCRNMDQTVGTPATYLECFEFFLAPYPVGGTTAQGDPAKAPDVTTNSWTCPPSEGCSTNTLQAGVEAQRAAGIIMVVAAGNSGSACSTVSEPPAIYDAAYTVGAIDHTTGLIASFSSLGPVTADGSNRVKPDITAPGVNIRSATRTTTTAYTILNGTSMASPHVAGAMALLLSALPSLQNQVTDAEGYLNDTAVAVTTTLCSSSGTPNNVYGFGRLDVKAAVDLALTTVSPTMQNVGPMGGSALINVNAPTTTVNWTATTTDSWITNITPASGTGSGAVTFQVAPYAGATFRSGTITIARKTFVVTQASPTGGRDGILQFGAASFSARKTDGSITITVRHNVSLTTDPVTVDYYTADGTASERSDYIPASGTLQFNFGETTKSFKVLINNNGYVTGTRTVNLVLENPSGDAGLGATRTAVLQLEDTNTVEPSINPSDDTQFFVRQQYYDFLGREPDPDGLVYWTNEIGRCGSDRACINERRRDVSAAFFSEDEFQQTGFFVYRMFKASFGRQPGYQRFSRDRNQVTSGPDVEASKTAFANRWVQRTDFRQQYPDTMTVEAYVDSLNYNSGNGLTQAQRNALVQGLNSGSEIRATALAKVAENQTFQNREYNPAFVLMQYFGYLRRDIDQGGYDFWLDVLSNREPGNFQGMVCAFITSAEYQNRFGFSRSHSDAECGQ